MATRTQKAAMKSKAETAAGAKPAKATKSGGAKTAKSVGKSAAKGKAAGSKTRKTAKGDSSPEAPQVGESVITFKEERPSFLERFKQRRAEKAETRAIERQAREVERQAADERARALEAEQRALREEQESQDRERREREERASRERREREEKEALALQAAEDRKARAAAKRADAKAAKEDAIRLETEAAEAKVAEEVLRAEEKAVAQEAARQKRAAERQAKRDELEAEERRVAAEQAAKDAEAEVEARRLAANQRLVDEEKARRTAEPKELEPDLEFEEASKPVRESDALVPAKGGATAADAQADLVAAELSKRRSKPVVIVGDEPEAPRIPKARLRPGEEEVVLAAPERVDGPRPSSAPPQQEFGFTIPEAFLLLANEGGWDERAEQVHEGAFGGALAGAMALELLMRGAIMVQRDRFTPTGDSPDDPALVPIADRLRRIREKKGDIPSLQQMGELAKWNRDLLSPFKERLAGKGLATHGSRKHLGLFHRSWVEITDVGAQERLQNRLRRAIAGGGTPEAASILLLGLLDASGLFATVVPDEAADYNRKRLNGLLGGRDIMGYKVDPALKALQEIATRTVLNNVRLMTVRG